MSDSGPPTPGLRFPTRLRLNWNVRRGALWRERPPPPDLSARRVQAKRGLEAPPGSPSPGHGGTRCELRHQPVKCGPSAEVTHVLEMQLLFLA